MIVWADGFRVRIRLLVSILGVQNAPFVGMRIVVANVFFSGIHVTSSIGQEYMLFIWGKGSSQHSRYFLAGWNNSELRTCRYHLSNHPDSVKLYLFE